MRTLAVDGAELAYELEGQGDEVVAFVHGWCSKLQHWDAQAQHLRRGQRVLRWDRRGMGRSRADLPADAPARHAQDLAAILGAEGIDRATVVGHAGGGPTALAFAAEYADRTDGLVLVDTRLHAAPAPGAADRFAEGVARSCEQLLGPDGDAFFGKLYRSFFGPRAPEDVVADAVENALATPRAIAVAEMGHMLGDTMAVARRARCPVLWVSAQPDDSAIVRQAFTDVMIGHVVGSGHFVQLEVPEQLNAMIGVFLAARA
ncbi:MAG: alpha/beta fold hydrolase [Acidimicrobiia bacterium]|nr:alpha/beta fold hydrolase [Acidimicrobiia bacterium]